MTMWQMAWQCALGTMMVPVANARDDNAENAGCLARCQGYKICASARWLRQRHRRFLSHLSFSHHTLTSLFCAFH
jgi:hypothetical protein